MIVARGLTKRYSDTAAVDDLSFEVRPGVVTGFLGPNGAGKSTTMRLMLDLDYEGGQTRFDGRRFHEVTPADARDRHSAGGRTLPSDPEGAQPPADAGRGQLHLDPSADEVLALVGLAEVARRSHEGSPWAWRSGSGSRRPCSMTRTR